MIEIKEINDINDIKYFRIDQDKIDPNIIHRIVVATLDTKISVPNNVLPFKENFDIIINTLNSLIKQHGLDIFNIVFDEKQNSLFFYNKKYMNISIASRFPRILDIMSFDQWCASILDGDNHIRDNEIDRTKFSITLWYNDSDNGDSEDYSETLFYYDFFDMLVKD